LVRIRYEGFERVDRLIPIALIEGEVSPLPSESSNWLLEHEPQDKPALAKVNIESLVVDDAVEEMAFTDQLEVTGQEQVPFERNLEQLERYVEDQLLVLRRRLSAAQQSLHSAQDKRDSALGAELRSQAEARVRSVQEVIDATEAEIARLETRDDADYQKWRRRVQQRRDKPPQIHRLLDVEFVLE
jgi:hypothetical protein